MQKKLPPNHERKKILLLSLFILLLGGGWIVFGPYGVIKFYNLRNELKIINARNQQLKEENEALQKEIHRLTKDQAYIEEVARKKFGLIKKNEIIFEFEERRKKKH